jgi:hypothetical protein
MPRHLPNEPSDQPVRLRGAVAGNERVAHRFLPACPASNLIRLNPRRRRHAANRRQLARLVDPRRAVS